MSALRAHDNPALTAAICAANYAGLPLLVIYILEDNKVNCTARRHHFILEALAELSAEFTIAGIRFAIQMQSPGKRNPHYLTLAHRAALVVADEPFVQPYLATVQNLRRAAPALWLVDSACVVPAKQVRASDCARAYKYESSTAANRAAQLAEKLDEVALVNKEPVPLSFEPLEIEGADDQMIDAFVKLCAVDHSVGRVGHTRGGSSAGYQRWRNFCTCGLKLYSKRRNNPLQHHAHGVSRMSPYLNLGMVSPFRVARQGAASGKFVNEMQTWREITYAYCFHHPEHLTLSKALPTWAYRTLSAHASDRRPRQLSLAQMASASTGDEYWDAAQRSLIVNGELHNNIRMTWGKAVLHWTASPDEAYNSLVYLNDHYALDGQAPPSYGGLLWCFGLFDGPKKENSISGSVAQRPTYVQAKRLDLAKFEAQTLALSKNAQQKSFFQARNKNSPTAPVAATPGASHTRTPEVGMFTAAQPISATTSATRPKGPDASILSYFQKQSAAKPERKPEAPSDKKRRRHRVQHDLGA
jgi:photolyase PhrII